MDSAWHILAAPIRATADFHSPSSIMDLGVIDPSFLRPGSPHLPFHCAFPPLELSTRGEPEGSLFSHSMTQDRTDGSAEWGEEAGLSSTP